MKSLAELKKRRPKRKRRGKAVKAVKTFIPQHPSTIELFMNSLAESKKRRPERKRRGKAVKAVKTHCFHVSPPKHMVHELPSRHLKGGRAAKRAPETDATQLRSKAVNTDSALQQHLAWPVHELPSRIEKRRPKCKRRGKAVKAVKTINTSDTRASLRFMNSLADTEKWTPLTPARVSGANHTFLVDAQRSERRKRTQRSCGQRLLRLLVEDFRKFHILFMNSLAESKKRRPKRKRGRSLFVCDSVILKIMGDGVAKLDEVKEILNTLRIWLSYLFYCLLLSLSPLAFLKKQSK